MSFCRSDLLILVILFWLLEFQKFVYTSLTHMKFDISAMMHIINETSENVIALIACSNKYRGPTTTSLNQSYVDMNIFSLTDQLRMVEDQTDIM